MRICRFKWYLLFILIFFSALSAHPWQQLTGKYARVEFQKPYQATARYLLTIANKEIPRLAKLQGCSASDIASWPLARIILTDKPDVSNGFALQNTVVVYARSSMFMPYWSESKDWYRLVLTHELAHWVTYRAVKRRLSFLGGALNLTVPRWFYEGIAQYLAESWNTFRGDATLKRALLAGKLNQTALENTNNGTLLYATANAFVRYLATEYGDSSLIRLLRYKPNAWYFDFDEAFKNTYKKSVQELFPRFVRQTVLFYGDYLAHLPLARFPEKLPKIAEHPVAVYPLSSDDSLFLVAGKEKSIDMFYSVMLVQKNKGKVNVLKRLTGHLGTKVVLSPDHQYIAFGRPFYSVEDNQTALRFQWYVFNRKNQTMRKLRPLLRARYGAFDYDGRLYLVNIGPERSQILRFTNKRDVPDTIYAGEKTIGYITFTPQNRLIAEVLAQNGDRRVCRIVQKKMQPLSLSATQQRNPYCLSRRYLALNTFRHNQPVIVLYDLQKDTVASRFIDQYGYWIYGVDSLHSALLAYRYGENNHPGFFRLAQDSLLNFGPALTAPRPNVYGLWQKKFPVWPDTFRIADHATGHTSGKAQQRRWPQFPMEHLLSFALPFYDSELGYGFYGTSAWLEALQRQSLLVGFWMTPLHPNNSVFLLNHEVKMINLDWDTYVYYGPLLLSHPEGTRQQINVSVKKTKFVHGNRYFRVWVKGAYSYFYHKFKNKTLYPVGKAWFNGPSIHLGIFYRSPTSNDNALPWRKVSGDIFAFKTLSHSNYVFRLIETNFQLATHLWSERLGIVERFSFIRQSGKVLPFQIVGIDRYYQFDMPREYLFTRTLRGFSQNVDTDRLLWNSVEIRYLLKKSTPYQCIFLPINNLTMDMFWDYAHVGLSNLKSLHATGLQISFGNDPFRLSAGYARIYQDKRFQMASYFLRMAILLDNIL